MEENYICKVANRDYIKTLIEYEQSQEAPLKKEEDVILFYKKKIK